MRCAGRVRMPNAGLSRVARTRSHKNIPSSIVLSENRAYKMPLYHIHRMRDLPRQQFRWLPHTSGVTVVKPKDYELREPGHDRTIEAATPYAAWVALRGSDTPLDIGDILEAEGELRILKFVGF